MLYRSLQLLRFTLGVVREGDAVLRDVHGSHELRWSSRNCKIALQWTLTRVGGTGFDQAIEARSCLRIQTLAIQYFVLVLGIGLFRSNPRCG
jgi:hypothetical protein